MPKGKYFIANEEDGCSLLAMTPFSTVLPLRINKKFKNKLDVVAEIRHSHFRWCPNTPQYRLMGEEVLEKIIKDKNYVSKLTKQVIKISNSLMHFAERLRLVLPSTLSSKALAEVVETHYHYVLDMLEYGFSTSMMELSNDLFSNYLREIIAKQISKYGKRRSAAEYFEFLTEELRPTPLSIEKYKRFLLASKITKLRGRNLNEKLQKELLRHAQEYFWVDFGYQGPVRSPAYFKKEVMSLVSHGIAHKELLLIKKRQKMAVIHRKTAEHELHLSVFHKRLFADARDCIYMKNYRKEALIFSLAVLEKYLKEVAKRAKVSLGEVRCCLPTEIMDLLKGKLGTKELKERDKMIFYYVKNKRVIVETGKKAHGLIHKFIVKDEATNEQVIRGATGCAGYAKGAVKIINTAKDMKKMNTGDILVSIATVPELVPAMKKAGAIVTDIGGITSHAAIVSRELRKPCVIGTRIATKSLKDGDMVEVDASHGWVKKI